MTRCALTFFSLLAASSAVQAVEMDPDYGFVCKVRDSGVIYYPRTYPRPEMSSVGLLGGDQHTIFEEPVRAESSTGDVSSDHVIFRNDKGRRKGTLIIKGFGNFAAVYSCVIIKDYDRDHLQD